MIKDLIENSLVEEVNIFSKPSETVKTPENIELEDDEEGSSSWLFKKDKFSIYCRINHISISLEELADVLKLVEFMTLIDENPTMFGKLDDFIKLMNKLTKLIFNLSLYDLISNGIGKNVNWKEGKIENKAIIENENLLKR